MSKHPASAQDPALAAIAASFVQARLQGRALAGFPGQAPADLAGAYRVQDLAIAQWPDRIVGWKVGYIAEGRREASGDDRLLGPIFARSLQPAADVVDIAVFAGGFGAVEAEYVLQLDGDAPAGKDDWTPAQVEDFPARLFTGAEVASSPLATINALGPCVVVSDFGNNNGLVLGAEIADWKRIPEPELVARTWIGERLAGSGGATTLPGGLRAALAFALNRSARRGRPLQAGTLVATGNATGIHDIAPGEDSRVEFDGHGALRLRAVAARPHPRAEGGHA